MANLKLYGQVVEIMEPQQGITQTGSQWYSQSFIVEELGTKYPSKASFTLFDKHLTQENVDKLFIGNDITISFNIYMKDRTNADGKRYINTDLRGWKVEQGDTTQEVKQQPKEDGEFTPFFAPTEF